MPNKKLVRLRVISLRFNDYMAQSGRAKHQDKNDKTGLFSLVTILKKFAGDEKNKKLIMDKGYITEKKLGVIISKSEKELAGFEFRTVLTYYSQALKGGDIKKSDDQYFYFVEDFLNEKEKEFGLDYKYDFYKDIYEQSFVGIKEGIYKLERLSSLNRGSRISRSKLVINKCIDTKGKNVFLEPNRIRLRFSEKKWSNGKIDDREKKYITESSGRIVIRRNRDKSKKIYMFMGASAHWLDTGVSSDNERDKTLPIMNMRYFPKEEALKGVVVDVTGKDLIPFASRIKATFLANNEAELKDKFLNGRNESDYFSTRDFIENEDDWFKNNGGDGIEGAGKGLLSAFNK